MEKNKDTRVLLELLPQPAFCVCDGRILCCNHSASQLFILPDTQVSELLGDGAEDYRQFEGNSMYLALRVGTLNTAATVTRTEEYDLFALDMDPGQTELKAMALSAVYLREPLAHVVNITQRLYPQLQGKENEEILAMLNRNIYQLQRMVCNMSDASQYATAPVGAKEWMRMDAVLKELVEKTQTAVSSRGLTLRCKLPEKNISAPIVPAQLERALYNLISNAIRASKPDGTIDISLSQSNGKARISVRDYGAGVPASERGKVFSRFTRHAGLTDTPDGIGLGLSLVCSAALAHGGAVYLDCPPDGGTRLSMTISLQEETGGEMVLRNTPMTFDYAGERDHTLLELSDVLPAEVYRS